MLKRSIFIILTWFLWRHFHYILNHCECLSFFIPFYKNCTISSFLTALWPTGCVLCADFVTLAKVEITESDIVCVSVCACVSTCVRVCMRACDMYVMGTITGVMYMTLSNDCCCNKYAYFLCKLLCTFMILIQIWIVCVLLMHFSTYSYVSGFWAWLYIHLFCSCVKYSLCLCGFLHFHICIVQPKWTCPTWKSAMEIKSSLSLYTAQGLLSWHRDSPTEEANQWLVGCLLA